MNTAANDVVITGLGPVTSIGVGCDAFWAALAAGRSNVRTRTFDVDLAVSADLPIAAMPAPEQVAGLGPHLEFLSGQDCDGYRDLAYALLAIELALADAGVEYDRDDNDIGVIQAFEAPGVERTVSRLFEMFAGPPPTDGPPRVYEVLAPRFYNMQSFLYVHMVGKALGLHGFSTSVHNACSSGAFAVEVAAQRIRSGAAEVMLVAGGEAFDTAVRLEWFRRLGLYAQDDRMCPFDAESSGFYVGEGGGAIVLESAAHAAKRGARIYARYLAGAFAQQSFKQSTPDMRAARLTQVITRALHEASVTPAALDLIVPHGAATAISDGYEAACLAAALQSQAANAVATAFKPAVGHMLAASGIIDTLAAILALHHECVPATLHSRPEHVELAVPLVTARMERPLRTMLKLSTGFTGHDAALVFRRTEPG